MPRPFGAAHRGISRCIVVQKSHPTNQARKQAYNSVRIQTHIYIHQQPLSFFTHQPQVFTHHDLIHDRGFLNMVISPVKVVTDVR